MPRKKVTPEERIIKLKRENNRLKCELEVQRGELIAALKSLETCRLGAYLHDRDAFDDDCAGFYIAENENE